MLPVIHTNGRSDPQDRRWLETNVIRQKQPGYATVIARVDQGNLTADQMRGLASLAADAGDGRLRLGIDQNILLGFIPLARLRAVRAELGRLGLGEAGAGEIGDVTTCPGAYSCNLALTESMNLGAALQDVVRSYDDPLVRKLSIKVSGCPNSCGQHWIADFGFLRQRAQDRWARIPYYRMLGCRTAAGCDCFARHQFQRRPCAP